jgi:hypothetical protein
MNHYRIAIWGYGSDVVLGKATKQQYVFWNDEEQLTAAGFEEDEGALAEYMLDPDEWDKTIPKMARFNKDWTEIDDYLRILGSTLDSAKLLVEHVSSPEWDAMAGETVYDNTLLNFGQTYKKNIKQTEFVLDDLVSEPNNYVFYGMSAEKGNFFTGIVSVEGDIDLSKLTFKATEIPNGDNLVDIVMYDGENVENLDVDLNGKGTFMEVWDW